MSTIEEYPSELPPSSEVNRHIAMINGEPFSDTEVFYKAPDEELWFGERDEVDFRVIAYTDLGKVAFVDVVEKVRVHDQEILGSLLLRINGRPDRIVQMLHHTAVFAPPEDAERVFGRVKLSSDETFGMDQAA